MLILGTALAWGFVGVGSYAWQRRPENRTGALMVLTGLTMLISGLQFSDNALLYTIGLAFDAIVLAPFAHLCSRSRRGGWRAAARGSASG